MVTKIILLILLHNIYTIILLKSLCLSVGVRILQVAILARSSREMYLTVRIVWQYILSRVRVLVRHINFYMRKTLKTSGKPGRQCQCLFQWPATSYCLQRSGPSRFAGTDPSKNDTATAVCVWGVCARIRAGVCARLCVHACVCAWCVCNIR